MPFITHSHHVREKLLKYGPEKLSQEELLALLLGTGMKRTNVLDISANLFQAFPAGQLARAGAYDLAKASGLSVAKVCGIVACFELGKRLLQNKKTSLYLSAEDVWDALKDIRSNKKEHFVVFYLDTQRQEIARDIISIGTLNANLVHPREVFEPAVRHLAAELIIAHNHPSGNPDPSDEDMEVTFRLVEAGKLLGIEVIDHVIVAHDGFISLREAGLLV